VFDHRGVSIAALSVSGPTSRILNADTADLGALLREHAEAVSVKLGYSAA
jgi:IclR family acetate operon transcriptional repressor